MIPYGRQDVTGDDLEAVLAVLKSDFLTQGPMVPVFESSLTSRCNAKYGVAVNSATSALHLACLSLGLGAGDILWTSPITFVASANCALYCGASVDFVDIDPETYNLSPSALEIKLRKAASDNRLPKILIPVHFSGQSCEMESIARLAREYGVSVIEDASHAIGGQYKGKPIGCCEYSDIAVFSFHPVKIVTTGEGGAAVTNSPQLAERISLLRSHGITRDPTHMTAPPDGAWYYQQLALGYNYRMTDIQAALGASQMNRLDAYVRRRREIAAAYDEAFAGLPVNTPWQHPDACSAWHLYVIRLRLDELNVTHKEVFDTLREQGVGVNLHYIPVHLQPYYEKMGFRRGNFPEAERYYKEAIPLPLHPTLSEGEIEAVVASLHRILSMGS